MHHVRHLAYIEILSTALYVLPRTSVLGALLLTAYLGGAACINLRAGDSIAVSPPLHKKGGGATTLKKSVNPPVLGSIVKAGNRLMRESAGAP